MSLKTETVRMTPDRAAAILRKNDPRNRPVSPRDVQRFVDHLRNGTWTPTHQGIGISSDGYLLDGQHRLLAIVKSGLTAEIQLTTGLPKSCFVSLDRGRPRRIDIASGVPKLRAETWSAYWRVAPRSASLSAEVVQLVDQKLGSQYDVIFGSFGSFNKFPGPMRLAVIASVLCGHLDETMARGEVDRYVKDRFAEFSPGMTWLWKLLHNTPGVTTGDRKYLFGLTMAVFHPAKGQQKVFRDAIISRFVDEGVAVLTPYWEP